MSANLDLVRALYVDWERGDFGSDRWAHPEIEYVIADGPSPGRWIGLDGLVQAWRDQASTWDGFRARAETFRALDDERVLVLTRRFGRGKTSGVDLGALQARAANVMHGRDGKIARIVTYWDRDRALADLGLEE